MKLPTDSRIEFLLSMQERSHHLGVSENSVPLNPMVLLIIIPMKNGYFIGKINPTFSDKPICLDPECCKVSHSDLLMPAPACRVTIAPDSHGFLATCWCRGWTSRKLEGIYLGSWEFTRKIQNWKIHIYIYTHKIIYMIYIHNMI